MDGRRVCKCRVAKLRDFRTLLVNLDWKLQAATRICIECKSNLSRHRTWKLRWRLCGGCINCKLHWHYITDGVAFGFPIVIFSKPLNCNSSSFWKRYAYRECPFKCSYGHHFHCDGSGYFW